MAHPEHTPPLAPLEEALTVLFCRIDDAYSTGSIPKGAATRPSKSSPTQRSSP